MKKVEFVYYNQIYSVNEEKKIFDKNGVEVLEPEKTLAKLAEEVHSAKFGRG